MGWEVPGQGRPVGGGGWCRRGGRGWGLWVLAGVGGWGVVAARIGVVVGIVEVVGAGLWVVDSEVVLEAFHMVRHGGGVLDEDRKVGSGSAALYEAEVVEAMEEQTHSGGYFGVEVRWRCTGHGGGWVAGLTVDWQMEEEAAMAALSCLFVAVEAGLEAAVRLVRAALEAVAEAGE